MGEVYKLLLIGKDSPFPEHFFSLGRKLLGLKQHRAGLSLCKATLSFFHVEKPLKGRKPDQPLTKWCFSSFKLFIRFGHVFEGKPSFTEIF